MRQFEAIEDDNLTGSQLLVIAELLRGATVTSAALAADVHRTTVHRWLRNDPHFIADFNAAKSEHFDAVRQRILILATKAATVAETGIGVLSPPVVGPVDAADVQHDLDAQVETDRADEYLRSLFRFE